MVAVDGDYDCTAAAHDQAGQDRTFPTKTNAVPGDHGAANGENPEQYRASHYDQETEGASSDQQHDWPANAEAEWDDPRHLVLMRLPSPSCCSLAA
jgi:hypothetical protein